MDALTSQQRIEKAHKIVIKIGSALLVDQQSGQLRHEWLKSLAQDVAYLASLGKSVVLVSSGSIALGRHVLKMGDGELTLEQAQAAASVGQIRLARAYEEVLGPLGMTTAQVLVTLEDSQNRRRYLNSRATLATLLNLNVVPIVNENDTVATDEIRYGDNDRLAALVTSLASADCLILLSDVDGLYTDNPREDKNAEHIPLIKEITPLVEAMAGGAGTKGAKGGMKTKIMAAKMAVQAGADMAITLGFVECPVQHLMNGATASWFLSKADPKTARKKWIGSMKPKGFIHIDAGAERALLQGKSLLPAGVISISGRFQRGDCVEIIGPKGAISKALSGYDSSEADLIKGKQSTEITTILGYQGRGVLAHRDDMEI